MGRLVAAGVMVSLALLSAMAQAQSSERALMSEAVERSMLQSLKRYSKVRCPPRPAVLSGVSPSMLMIPWLPAT